MTKARSAIFLDLARRAQPALEALVTLGLAGALAVWLDRPWLFPSLGPTVFLHVVGPRDPASRLWNTFAGHAIGVAAGFAALFLCGAQSAPSVFAADAVAPGRAAATALAVAATILLQTFADAKHPPAAATTMLITLGGMKPTWDAVAAIVAGVALVTALGRAFRALLGRALAAPDAMTGASRQESQATGNTEAQQGVLLPSSQEPV